MKKEFLYAGQVIVSIEPMEIYTVLGSCISICIWDKKLHIGGMIHYMLPMWNGTGLATPKYGDIAIPKLVNKLYSMGSEKKDLVAKMFGGGAVIKTVGEKYNVGKRNILLGKDVLHELEIPIVSYNVGTNSGRKLKFFTGTGKILMKMLKKN